jgi:hypothetical protein
MYKAASRFMQSPRNILGGTMFEKEQKISKSTNKKSKTKKHKRKKQKKIPYSIF